MRTSRRSLSIVIALAVSLSIAIVVAYFTTDLPARFGYAAGVLYWSFAPETTRKELVRASVASYFELMRERHEKYSEEPFVPRTLIFAIDDDGNDPLRGQSIPGTRTIGWDELPALLANLPDGTFATHTYEIGVLGYRWGPRMIICSTIHSPEDLQRSTLVDMCLMFACQRNGAWTCEIDDGWVS